MKARASVMVGELLARIQISRLEFKGPDLGGWEGVSA